MRRIRIALILLAGFLLLFALTRIVTSTLENLARFS